MKFWLTIYSWILLYLLISDINKIASPETTDGKELSEKPAKTATCICEPPPDTYSTDTAISDQTRGDPDTNRYKLINIIDKKKRTGAYSRWRKNIIEPCICGVDVCDCNLNPAIVSSKLPDETCGCGQLQCQCKIIQQGEGIKKCKLYYDKNISIKPRMKVLLIYFSRW